jgi:DNA-binding GntR family transcriptional regulator
MTAARNGLIKSEIIRYQSINRVVTASASKIDPGVPAPRSRDENIAMARSTVLEDQEIFDAIIRRDAAAARAAMERALQEDVDSVLRRMAGAESRRIERELTGTNLREKDTGP